MKLGFNFPLIEPPNGHCLNRRMGKEIEQFRKRVIRSTLFPKTSVPAAMKRMGFVQADPIRAPARAQDLILRQRVRGYKAGDLEARYAKLPLEEYFLFAYGFGSKKLWQHLYPKTDSNLSKPEKAVLSLVQQDDFMHPRTLEGVLGAGRARNAWGGQSRSAKLALESLHRRGALRIVRREKGIRIYGLAESFESTLSKRERFQEIVLAALRSMGPTSKKFLMSELRHFDYLEKSRGQRLEAIDELIATRRTRVDRVDSVEYLSLADSQPSRIPLDQVRILSPFDPIVRDRERFQHLWGWEYRFEAYTPPEKRKLGYYAMPVLWKDAIIGWANASVAHNKLSLEFGYADERHSGSDFKAAAEREAAAMATFIGINDSEVKVSL